MKITATNYESLKGFYGWMVGHLWPSANELPADAQPLNVLSAFESKSPALARRSLHVGIGDILEETEWWVIERTQEIDLALTLEGLPSLSAVRLEFSKKIESIMARSKVRSEIEYYALRNVVEAMPNESSEKAWQMLAAFEEKVGSK